MDLAAAVEPVYGAPPLLNEKVQTGELDAVLNYWHFAARLDAKGYKELVGVEEAISELGGGSVPPQLGYVFFESFAAQNPELIAAFADASRAAKELLKTTRNGSASGRSPRPRTTPPSRRSSSASARASSSAGASRSAPMPPRCTRSWRSSAASSWSAGRPSWRPAPSGQTWRTERRRGEHRGAGIRAAGGGCGAADDRPGRRLRPALIPAASIAGLILLWQLGALIADDPRRLPTPGAVLNAIIAYTASGELPYHLSVTLLRVAASFVIAMAIGSAIGLAMGRLPLFDRIAHPWLVFLLNIPALSPSCSRIALIFAVAINKIPNAVVMVREGARALDRSLLEMAAVYRIGWRRTLQQVVLPQLYPYLAAAARSGLALIWKIVLVTELLGRSSGVGFQIGLHFQLFDVTGILAYAIAFVAVIQIIEWTILLPLERHVSRWRR